MNIDGLSWKSNWRIDNGQDSYVVPFPQLRPAQLAFHGSESFSYGQYGIHLSQDDILTFLGPSSQAIKGSFVDCRKGSRTYGQRDEFEFSPSSAKSLVIPRGVAHDFSGLENVFTLNTYKLYLPEPDDWEKSEWQPRADVVNFPSNTPDDKLPTVEVNDRPVGDRWYNLVRFQQQAMIPLLSHEYPVTQDVVFEDGSRTRISLLKRTEKTTKESTDNIEGIDGLRWENIPYVSSGEDSGFVPLNEPYPLYFIDHGESTYTHDAFGIHLGQEDHLLFVGPAEHVVSAEFIDAREFSPTYGARISIRFHPNPTRYLRVPPGVGHAFNNLESVFTINRAPAYLPEGETLHYHPGSDVIDWPRESPEIPKLQPNTQPATGDFYARQIADQKELQKRPPKHATPTVMLIDGPNGEKIRVALRQKVD